MARREDAAEPIGGHRGDVEIVEGVRGRGHHGHCEIVLSRRVSVLIALTALPILVALVTGFGGELGTLIGDGLVKVAPVAIMITFAVLYFSLMGDAGLFDPAITRVLRWAKGDPLKITVGTAVLTLLGMIEAMARSVVGVIPDSAGGALPVVVAITGMPLSLVFTPDAYYFGVLPVLAETSVAFGGSSAEVGTAAILGQMTTGFPLSPLTASTFILLGMSGVELGAHQRFLFKWAFGTTIVMTAVALLTGAISF